MACFRFLLPALLTALLAACAATGPKFDPRAPAQTSEAKFQRNARNAAIPADWLRPPLTGYHIGPGDKLEIEMLGTTSLRQNVLVGPDGRIYYDLLPGTDVAGLTVEEARRLLQEKLAAFYRAPQVSVTLLTATSQHAYVLGRVNKPGLFPLTRPTTVIDAIAQAGGLFTSRFSGTTEELADLDHSFVMRDGTMLPVNFDRLLRQGDMSQNIYLKNGDFVYLPSSLTKQIHVMGAVKQARPVGFSQEMSLVAAISTALGPLPNADLQHVTIVRGALVEPQVAIVDFAAIQQGRAPNIRLEPHDIVYVPVSGATVAGKFGEMVVNTFVRTVAANEGSRAAVSKAEPIRPQLTIGN